MAATDLKEEMVEFANAEKRWRTQIAEGKVKSLSAKEAGYTYQLSDYVLLDVRPSYQHNKAGYRNIYWLTGGFDTASDEDFEREGPVPLQLAGIGGMSEFIGWTDPQRRLAKTEGWQYRATFFGRLLVVFLAADLALIGLQQLSSFFRELGQ
ncbi:unnamed protein product [Closterium sp. NIES-64]|nr:unnamed protein product [Closterium sp. NIES-64]